MPRTTDRASILLGVGVGAALIGLVLRRRTRTARRLAIRPATALITGASSGLGAEFARQLAAHGYNLILVGRRSEKLQALARDLQQRYMIAAETLTADLATDDGIARVQERLRDADDLQLLVNNAGFGLPGDFSHADITRDRAMIQVHVVAPVALTRAALDGMLRRGRGAIVNVSSVAAFVPQASHPSYTSTKAYLNSFSESLQSELSGTGVHVEALCPGFVHTEFHSRPEYGGLPHARRVPGFMWMSAHDVVAASLSALARDQVIVVPGLLYQSIALAARTGLIPLAWGIIRKFYWR